MPERTRPFMKLLIAEKGQEIAIDTLQSLSPRLEMRRHMEGPAALPTENRAVPKQPPACFVGGRATHLC